MKILNPVFLVLLITLFSCKKDDSNIVPPTDPPVVHDDTLSVGWSKQVITSGGFNDIVFLNNTIGYVSGDSMYKTIDGGNTWNKVTSFISGLTYNLAVTNDNKVFSINTSSNTIARSPDGGTTFAAVTLGGISSISDIFFIDNNNGFGLSSYGVTRTTDGGITWDPISPITSFNSGSRPIYTTGWFFSSTSGLIASSPNVFKSNGNLNSWTQSVFTGGVLADLPSLFAVSSSLIYAGSGDGKIFQSTDGGTTFNLKSTLPLKNGNLADVYFIDSDTGYVSYGSRIYKSIDGGSTWQVVVAMGESKFVEIDFTDATHGWGCTDKGEVVKLN